MIGMLEDNDDRGYGDDGDLIFIPRIVMIN